ncbi:class I SAM-dependent methyltransferase [Archangium lipolyticum]|uniref:class I SAM-dependent methyltransferase n=1 Tax=Archangium lipolyticum TaxID=2970465 RepID=UPI00214A5CCD|nr:class I SAM-dependent methyltransferase [Archangium lipolyticum]
MTHDDLEDFELPFFQRLVIQLWALLLGFITRLTDVLLLLFRPRLLRPYFGIWLAERLHSPYRARRTFEVVRALKATGQRFRELIYGETPLVTALLAFRRAGVGPGCRLVDLGAGRGRVLIAARWLGAEVRGVELLADHVTSVAKWLQPAGITLVEGDATRADLGDATHVFTNWLALTPETKARLVERFRDCRPGTRIITVTRPIESEDFPVLSSYRMLFTWGFERVWIHEYRPAARISI